MVTIRSLEEVLRVIEGNNRRDGEQYYFTVFGEPSDKGTWGWRYEGHHASFNWTMVEGRVAGSSPQFMGANPADVKDGPRKGTRASPPRKTWGAHWSPRSPRNKPNWPWSAPIAVRPQRTVGNCHRQFSRGGDSGRQGHCVHKAQRHAKGLLLSLIQGTRPPNRWQWRRREWRARKPNS